MRLRRSALGLLILAIVVVALSWLFRVPYVYTILSVAAWTAIGHLVTLDDDAPGGWGNLEESNLIWRRSLAWLVVEFAVLLGIFSVIVLFPNLKSLGA